MVNTQINCPTTQSFCCLAIGVEQVSFTDNGTGIENNYLHKAAELSQFFSILIKMSDIKENLNLKALPNNMQALIALLASSCLMVLTHQITQGQLSHLNKMIKNNLFDSIKYYAKNQNQNELLNNLSVFSLKEKTFELLDILIYIFEEQLEAYPFSLPV